MTSTMNAAATRRKLYEEAEAELELMERKLLRMSHADDIDRHEMIKMSEEIHRNQIRRRESMKIAISMDMGRQS